MNIYKTITLFLLILTACNNSKEIYQKNRNNIVYVNDKIVDIHIDSPDIFGRSWIYILNDYLIIVDHQAHDKGIHLINKNSFKYLTSTGDRGRGPGEIVRYGHFGTDNPVKLTTFFAFCGKNNIYAEGYARHDLLTIHNIDGEIKYNIYGPEWRKGETMNRYYSIIGIMHNKIIASSYGDITYSQSQRPENTFPTRFLIFDLNGNYRTTLETGHGINDFCLDEENNRIIIYFEDRLNPLAYIDLDGIFD